MYKPIIRTTINTGYVPSERVLYAYVEDSKYIHVFKFSYPFEVDWINGGHYKDGSRYIPAKEYIQDIIKEIGTVPTNPNFYEKEDYIILKNYKLRYIGECLRGENYLMRKIYKGKYYAKK